MTANSWSFEGRGGVSTELVEETRLMDELRGLMTEVRKLAIQPGSDEFRSVLERQAGLLRELEARRNHRAAALCAMKQPTSDFLVVALSRTPPAEQGELVETFHRYVRAAEEVEREVEVNRRFFRAALSTVNGALEQVVNRRAGGAQTYDARGVKPAQATAVCLSTST